MADVLQIDNKKLIQRKTLLFLATVDPKRVSAAISGLTAGFLAVIATLKLEFAKVLYENPQKIIASNFHYHII